MSTNHCLCVSCLPYEVRYPSGARALHKTLDDALASVRKAEAGAYVVDRRK